MSACVGDAAARHRRLFGPADRAESDRLRRHENEIISRPPVLLIHGDMDTVVPPESLELSAQGLKILDIDAETHMSHGIGHGIDQDGLQRGGVFLARAFARS